MQHPTRTPRIRLRALLAACASTVALMSLATAAPVGAERGGASGAPAAAVSTAMGRIDAGAASTCAVRAAGWAFCWGDDQLGQIANGPGQIDSNVPSRVTPAAGDELAFVQLTVGGSHVCGIADRFRAGATARVVVCWGSNLSGQALGAGTQYDVAESYAAPPVGEQWTAISGGLSHTCALTTAGSVYCWGANGTGQLGQGDTDNRDAPTLVALPNDAVATKIAAGQGHTCVITDAAALICWGAGNQGQLGNGGVDNVGDDELLSAGNAVIALPGGRTATAVASGNDHTCVVMNDGAVTCWGFAGQGRLGDGANTGNVLAPPVPVALPSGSTAQAVAAGGSHSCALLADSTVTCWGGNADGKIGIGTDVDQRTPGPKVQLPGAQLARSITTGDSHTCVLTSGDDPVCWGSNVAGRSGYPAPEFIGDDETPAAQGIIDVQYPTTVYAALTPQRLLDTRPGTTIGYSGAKPGADSTVEVSIPASVSPRGLTYIGAVVLNVTATDTSGPGFVTAYAPDGPRPLASSLNHVRAGQTIPNLVTVPVSADGKVALYTSSGTHLVADLVGVYTQSGGSKAGRLELAPTPTRIYDTRPATLVTHTGGKPAAGEVLVVPIRGAAPVPATGVGAVVVNVTVTETEQAGFLTVWPEGTQPLASNVNYDRSGQTIANQVIVPIGADGAIRLFTLSSTHIVLDVVAWYTDGTAPTLASGLFVPTTPYRHLDTRPNNKLAANGVVAVDMVGVGHITRAGVSAVVTNVTATEPASPSFLALYSAGLATPPLISNVNVDTAGLTIANQAISAVDFPAGRVRVFSLAPSHVIVDSTGYFI
jgi:alpha-tubulin suppressor-like RCC1 family protein